MALLVALPVVVVVVVVGEGGGVMHSYCEMWRRRCCRGFSWLLAGHTWSLTVSLGVVGVGAGVGVVVVGVVVVGGVGVERMTTVPYFSHPPPWRSRGTALCLLSPTAPVSYPCPVGTLTPCA